MVDQLSLPEPKTRLMAKALNALVGDIERAGSDPGKEAYEGVIRSTRNLPDAKILLANYLNIRDLLVFDKSRAAAGVAGCHFRTPRLGRGK